VRHVNGIAENAPVLRTYDVLATSLLLRTGHAWRRRGRSGWGCVRGRLRGLIEDLTVGTGVRLVAERPLPGGVAAPAVLALVLAPTLARAGRVPELAAVSLRAVALPAKLRDADPEGLAAVEALDLVEFELDRISPCHCQAMRASTSSGASGTLYTVALPSTRCPLRRLPGRFPQRPGAPPRPNASLPPPAPSPRLPARLTTYTSAGS
jgi:hypothetical protein